MPVSPNIVGNCVCGFVSIIIPINLQLIRFSSINLFSVNFSYNKIRISLLTVRSM